MESLAKQVSSLNARAAHTANNQLTLLQDENKRMVAERTVLQTQVRKWRLNKLVTGVICRPNPFHIFQASKAAHEKERLEGSLKILKEKVEVLESAEVERENLERENSTLKSNLEELQGLQEIYDQLQEKVSFFVPYEASRNCSLISLGTIRKKQLTSKSYPCLNVLIRILQSESCF